jgi:beta-phosphoglucomutase-like phosphatase (HAD superfamily)
VLVDSEPITNGVLRDMLQELGWTLAPAECMRLFIGKAVKDERAIIEARTGRPLTDAWLASFRERRNAALMQRLQAIPGAVAAAALLQPALRRPDRLRLRRGPIEVELQLKKCGLLPYFEGRIFSGHELPRSKPAPDVYLAAAAALGVDPRQCAVVEDTVTGVTAGVAAGATVFGYSPPESGTTRPRPCLTQVRAKCSRIGRRWPRR